MMLTIIKQKFNHVSLAISVNVIAFEAWFFMRCFYMSKIMQVYKSNGFTMRNKFRIKGNKCYIELSQNKEAIIDVEDIDIVGKHRWCASKDRNTFYALCTARVSINQKTINMHRLLLNTPKGLQTDHRDHNGLNNTRNNIRIVTSAENGLNRRSDKGSSSTYLGVSYVPQGKNCWRAVMQIKGVDIKIGAFSVEREAGIARAKAFVEKCGEDANPEQTALAKEDI